MRLSVFLLMTVIACPFGRALPYHALVEADPKGGCQIVEDDGYGLELHRNGRKMTGLTPFWAQEYVGADLVRFDVARSGLTLSSVATAIFDSFVRREFFTGKVSREYLATPRPEQFTETHLLDYPAHATSAANLLGGKAPYGCGHSVELALNSFLPPHGWGRRLAFQAANKVNPDLVNVSAQLEDDWFSGDELEKLAKKSIIVASAGNRHRNPVAGHKARVPMVLVANLNHDGLIDDSSQEGPEILVSAPGDWAQTFSFEEKDGKLQGKRMSFGGTSAATPIVLGAIANVFGILGRLPFATVATLLQKTAVPTLHSSEKPRLNGHGMVNAYKLYRVALRARALTKKGEKVDFTDPKLYDFEDEAKTKSANAEKLLKSTDDCDIRDGLRLARAAFLLAPTADRAEKLAKTYEDLKFDQNGRFYRSFSQDWVVKQVRERLASKVAGPSSALSAGKALRALDSKISTKILKEAFASSDQATRLNALRVAPYVETHGVSILKEGLDSRDEVTRRTAAESLWGVPVKEVLPLLLAVADDKSPTVRGAIGRMRFRRTITPELVKALFDTKSEEAIRGTMHRIPTLGKDAMPFIEAVMTHDNPDVRHACVKPLLELGPSSSKQLASMVKDRSSNVRYSLALNAKDAGFPLAGEILPHMLADSDLGVRDQALTSAIQLGPQGWELLDAFLEKGTGTKEHREKTAKLLTAARKAWEEEKK